MHNDDKKHGGTEKEYLINLCKHGGKEADNCCLKELPSETI